MAYKYDFKKISLMWRSARGERRICIGTVAVSKQDYTLSFEYNKNGIIEAQKLDPMFNGYPGIPLVLKNISSQQISEVFFGRLINSSRKDAIDFYKFWLVDTSRIDDKLYVLAQTQGLSFTDMFEFVPQYYCSHKHSFISDIAGLSRSHFSLDKINVGDVLDFTLDKKNEYDPYAVQISYRGENIGFIKKGHNTVFHRKNRKGIVVTVWNLTKVRGYEKIYVRIDIKA